MVERFEDPVVTFDGFDPYDTVAGAADYAAGGTDEFVGGSVDYLGRGVSGLGSLVDDEPGNTAGPGQEEWRAASEAADHGFVGGALAAPKTRNAILAVGGAFVGFKALEAFAEGLGSGVSE